MERDSAREVGGPEVDAHVAGLPASPSSDPAEAALNTELRHALLAALNRLPLLQREALVLRYYVDLPEKAVAAELGLSLNTVKSYLHRGRHHLRAALGSSALFDRVFGHGRTQTGRLQTGGL